MIDYGWQVTLHSATMGLILYLWVRRAGVRSGRLRRQLLALLIALPLVTAAVPGRASLAFAEGWAWFNSARLLAIPLPLGLRVWHVLAAGAVLTLAIPVWQELLPSLRARGAPSSSPPPERLVAAVRSQPGWDTCDVRVTASDGLEVLTTGRPGRPRLFVSEAALRGLSDEELDAVLAHEHAHWRDGRWWRVHALFVLRLLQSFNPVALWAFREYCGEVELDCDAAAVANRDPRVLARVQLRVYHATFSGDVAARSTLRKRVDVLLSGGPDNSRPPVWLLPSVAGLMLGVLPWLV